MHKIKKTLNAATQLLQGVRGFIALGATLSALSITASASCTYNIESEWATGFVANITIKNDTASTINNWNINWSYANNRITSSWNANLSGNGPYAATNLSWNSSIAVGQSVNFGFQGNKNSATTERPRINGTACTTTVATSAAPSSIARSSLVSSSLVRSSLVSSSLVRSSQGSNIAVSSSTVSSSVKSSAAPSSVFVSSSVVAPSSKPVASSSQAFSSSGYKVPANNFAKNGGVETDLTSWGATAGTLVRTTDEKHSGSASAFISGRTANWNGLIFNTGSLVIGSEYDVAVWVKLAPGVPDAVVQLTAKRQDDTDTTTYTEYTQVALVTASATEWRLLQGYYTPSGTTTFEHFIIESTDATVSFYADDFSIGGQAPVASSSSSRASSSAPTTTKFIGNITTGGAVRSDFSRYWTQISPENEGKWGSVEATRGVFNWTALDRIYAFARQNNIAVKAHTFVWGSQYPSWINNLSSTEQAAAIENWIRSYCTRYPDTKYIDVVNEAIPGHAPATFAQNAFGSNWMIKSFQLAKQYCPNATLILNDYNVLSWDTDKFIALAKPLIAAGVVDALGEQAHGLEGISAATVSSKLNQIAALGLPIYITEYDVAKTDDQTQLQIYQQQFPIFYNHPSVKGITLWGYVYGSTWVTGSGLIQSNGTPRPAMTWLLNNYIGK